MRKDKRYNTVRKLIDSNYVVAFEEILEIIPKTVIAKDLRMHHQTFEKLLKSPDRFTFRNLFRMASLMEVDKWQLAKIIFSENMKPRQAQVKKKHT